MIKEHLPVDHNDTHHTHPRTLWEAFKGRGDMFVSEPLISPEDKPFVIQLCVIACVALAIFVMYP
jgi:hypothetical protein